VIAIPNIRSAQKRLRQSEVRRVRNRTRKRAIRRVAKEIKARLDAGDRSGAEALLPALNKAADKAAQRHAIHRNKASRIKAQWARRIAEQP
jgi:small subunit ribosomal protein S20